MESRERWQSEITFLVVSWIHLLEKFLLRAYQNATNFSLNIRSISISILNHSLCHLFLINQIRNHFIIYEI